jgi:transcriptional regulator with XRE-family HTH domain
MTSVPDLEAQKVMGARFQVIREAPDLSQEEMSLTMGIAKTTLSGWEVGRNRIDVVQLARAADHWGFTTDWVARGDLFSLRTDLADKVQTILGGERAVRRGRQPSRPKGPELVSNPPPARLPRVPA